MSANVFRPFRLRVPSGLARPGVRVAAVTVALVAIGAGAAGCRKPTRGVLTRPGEAVNQALQPSHFAAAFRKLGRAHLRGTARFDVALDGGGKDTITTETDIWMDDKGNWRLVELNDKDGGREIVSHGHQLAVALRYGKMIRRRAEEPEPMHLLEEGVGAPFAAWDVVRDGATIDDFGEDTRAGRKIHLYKLAWSANPPPPSAVDPSDRRAWRRTVTPAPIEGTNVASKLDGTIAVDVATGVPLLAELRASYTMRRGAAGTPMHGAVDVRTSIEEIGQSPEIAEPEAEDLAPRQRTVPDEKALLGGLPRAPARPRGAP
ncbi:MAG TPA: hypothetical protein VIU64_08340 [Polyangia bacterium]